MTVQSKQDMPCGCGKKCDRKECNKLGVCTCNLDIKKILAPIKPKLFINNEFVDAVNGETFETMDPRTGEVLMTVAEAQAEDVDRAVKAAHAAYSSGPWPRMSGAERGKILFKWADLMEQHFQELCLIETLDNGKPITDSATADLPNTIACYRYFAGYADKIYGRTIPCMQNLTAYTLREPIGVVGAIIPWNFPLLMMAWKVAPALACGNTMVLKVAENTPLSALRVAELAAEAGLPAGVLNVIPGSGSVAGNALATHPLVSKMGFTGSTSVGKKIMQNAAQDIKEVTLELGGKSPVIVCPDVNIDETVDATHDALYFNMGQCCAAGSRMYVHEKIYDEFVGKVVKKAKARKLGDPFEHDTQQGPQVTEQQMNTILGYIKKGQEEGAKLLVGGQRKGDKGYWIEPTVFGDVTNDMVVLREEIFGPVLVISRWSKIDEVIKLANDTDYGLAAGVFTKDIDTMQILTRAIRAGTVWVNCYNVFDNGVPFGGYKQSGNGREKGEETLNHYTQTKSVYIPLKEPMLWNM